MQISEGNNESNKLNNEIDSVAIEWKSLRTDTTCECGTPFDENARKVFNKLYKFLYMDFTYKYKYFRIIVGDVVVYIVHVVYTKNLFHYQAMTAEILFLFVIHVLKKHYNVVLNSSK